MFTVAPARPSATDHLFSSAAPIQDQQLPGSGLTVLAVLIAVAAVLFSALRALLAAVAALLAPLFALARSFALVVGLIVLVGHGMLHGAAPVGGDEPGVTPASPTAGPSRPAPHRAPAPDPRLPSLGAPTR